MVFPSYTHCYPHSFSQRLFSLPLMFIFLSSIPILLFLDFFYCRHYLLFSVMKDEDFVLYSAYSYSCLTAIASVCLCKFLFNSQWLYYYGNRLIVS